MLFLGVHLRRFWPSLHFGALALIVLSCSRCLLAQAVSTGSNSDDVKAVFRNPPDDSRIMVRWWWFGAAVTKPELEREIKAMKAAGIGGFEVQPVYPLTLNDPAHGIVNLPFLSPGFLDDLHFAGETAKQLGMRFDLTLGSGWPYGGAATPVTEAAGALRIVKMHPSPGSTSLRLPYVGAGEKLIGAFCARPDPATKKWSDIRRLPVEDASGGMITLAKTLAPSQIVVFFIAGRTGMMVKRAAVGAEGFVLDHLDHDAVSSYLKSVGDPLMDAVQDDPPYAVFSDSLEVNGADWTPRFLDEFRAHRGYDLIPHLPALVADVGPQTFDIRYDWGRTVTELLNENYLQQIRDWAHQRHTQFRAQIYGPPGAILSSNELVDLPEGEKANWRGFSPIRWAASADHFEGHAVTSSESFTWTHTLPFRATPLDLKAEADVDFLEGSNQLIGHGWPYSPPYAAYPGWAFYAAGALDEQNPWWIVMPEMTKYMQRLSYVLRQGTPVNDVALLLPTEDAWALATPGPTMPNDLVESISDEIGSLLGTHVAGQILDAGFGLDYIDSHMIDQSGVRHPILILPGITRIPLATYKKVESFARSGGIVIATRTLPSRAPGLKEDESDSQQVREITKRLFQSPAALGRFLPDESELSEVLRKARTPDMSLSAASEAIGFVHRRVQNGADLYFVANTSNQAVRRSATFRSAAKNVECWDPFSGEERAIAGGPTIDLDLAPYESKILYFSSHPSQETVASRTHATNLPQPIDLSKEWQVSFPALRYSTVMRSLHSWTDDQATRFFSGEAVYKKDFDLLPDYLQPGIMMYLDFGPSVAVSDAKPQIDGMRAWLESPIREAALVYVNGASAGSVWHPPYQLDITKFLKPGRNHLEVKVANLAINSMAGRSAPDYRLLNDRYGERFTPPPGLQNLQPLPAGVLGDVQLLPVN